MTQETRTIEVKVYRTPDGKPTCCKQITAGEHCGFLRTRKLGTVDVCAMLHGIDLSRGDTGYIKPDADCELWRGALNDQGR